MMRLAPRHRPLLIALVALLVLPLPPLALGLTAAPATGVVILAIACMGLNLLVGELGLVSFGHGAFFGLAGYAAALAQLRWFPGAILAPSLCAIAAVAILAAVVGALILRRRGIYVALVTFVLPAMVLAAFRWTELNGPDGILRGVVRPAFGAIDLGDPSVYYVAVAAIGLAIAVLLSDLYGSPVGQAFVAIRENAQRARHIGYAADRYRLFAFTLSAALTALAGTLSAFHQGVATGDPISVTFSGALLAMVVIGGMRAFLGPALGALLFTLCGASLALFTPHWQLVTALLFAGFVLFWPTGVAGLVEHLLSSRESGATASGAAGQAVSDGAPLPAALAARSGNAGAVLIARELAKRHAGYRTVAGLDLVVESGTLHALVGPNGAGKATVLDLLSGVYPPDGGFITIAGRAMTGRAPEQFARAGVGRSFRTASLFGDLTVAENVRLAVQAGRRRRPARWRSAGGIAAVDAETAALLGYLGLGDVARTRAASLALDRQRLLDIALALASAPRVLLLDEPLAGLADAERARLAALIKDISRHIPVLLTEHDLDRVSAMADVVTVMAQGRMRFHGSAAAACAEARPSDRAAAAPPSAAGASTLLAVDRVNAVRGTTPVLANVSLEVCENEIVTLLGRNGAGKSTLLRAMVGVAPPASGSIRLAGEEIARLPSAAIAQRGIGYVPQDRGLFAGMTVEDNLALGRQKPAIGIGARWEDERIIWAFPRLARRWYTPADRLSAGEQQMVAIARALAGGARLLLLDEPFEGLPPPIAAELFEALDRLRYEIAMLLVDRGLDLALALSDRSVILDAGRVTWTGPSKLLREDPELRRRKLWV
ncbi:MAG TPA: ATP-binding cassette domain-containing protein [Xanthobacteraceae bacterium]|nr:ATP-binding cassette domain-containing protein [Xanthobacteraceae bacterium]